MSAHPIDRESVLPHIYGEVASGRSLDRVLSDDEGMPSASTFWRWHMEDEAIRDNLARARENGVERLLGECISIADDGRNDTYEDESGGVRVDTDVIQRSKLRIETRMKYAAMIAPRKYGPRIDHTSSDGSMSPPKSLAEFYATPEEK